ncbi:MAG: hypothetical protein J6B98_04425 [Bacilli bacterium]|nr:hypothetical protein [Bacilli bacterium]
MDFTKLNLEFSNMQNMINKYNDMVSIINQKIKSNDKDIGKYETRLKNNKNIIEKDITKLLLDSLKNENMFLKSLIENEVKKDEKSVV